MKKPLAFVALTFAFASFAHAQTPRFVMVTHGQASDPFWSVVKRGADQAAKDLKVKVEYRAPETFDMVKMGQLIDAAVASKPDGIIVSIPDADALGNSIEKAVKTGIPVISINSGADVYQKLGVLVHVGQEEYLAGKKAGERMKSMGVKNGVCINHEAGNGGLEQRCKGFQDGLGSKISILNVKTDFTEARNAISNYLQRNKNVDGMLALGPVGAEPMLQAVEQGKLRNQLKLGTFDLSPTVLGALDKNQMDFAIDQQQYLQGYLPVVTLSLFKKYGTLVANDTLLTGPGFVTPRNAKQVMDLSKKGIR